MPAQLLSAIALAASGRWDGARKAGFSWLWTVYAEGSAHYPPSKAEAVAEMRNIRTRGVRNIDVGCKQFILHYNAEAFARLDEAFDPAKNAAYAGGGGPADHVPMH